MKKVIDKDSLERAIKVASMMQELKVDEQRDVYNIVRGFVLAKGIDALPEPSEPPQDDKSA